MKVISIFMLTVSLTAFGLGQKLTEADATAQVQTLNSQIVSLVAANQLDRAAKLAAQASAIADASLVETNPVALVTLANLAEIQYRRKEARAAKELFERLVTLREKAFGSDDRNLIFALERLASLAVGRNDLKHSEELLTRALKLREHHNGNDDPLTIQATVNVASSYIKQKRFTEGEALFLEALGKSDKRAGPLSELSYSIADEYIRSVAQSRAGETRKLALALGEKRGVLVPTKQMLLDMVVERGPAMTAFRKDEVVTILVSIDEQGKVVSANAVGKPKDQAEWETTARGYTFKPQIINGKPVKVMGKLMIFPWQ